MAPLAHLKLLPYYIGMNQCITRSEQMSSSSYEETEEGLLHYFYVNLAYFVNHPC